MKEFTSDQGIQIDDWLKKITVLMVAEGYLSLDWTVKEGQLWR